MTWNAPAVTTKANADMSSSGGTFGLTHTSGATANRFAWLTVAWRQSSAITIIGVATVGGSTLTACDTHKNSAGLRAQAFYLINPPSAATDYIVSYSTGAVNASYVAGVATYYGVHQTTPFSNYTFSGGTSASSPRMSMSTTSSAVGDLAVAFHCANTNSSASPGGSQTERFDVARTGSGTAAGSLSDATGAASVTMTDTWSVDASTNWLTLSLSLAPVASSSATPPPVGIGDLVGPGQLVGFGRLVG